MIAGFSCVDYSNLNKKKKKAGEVGESRDTFYATLAYAKKCRPPLVVLENVSGAPWPEISNHWGRIGYSATHLKVDTKSYYLPQTRERGYMLCVDTSLLNKPNPGNEESLAWKELMIRFKRTASSPVDKFLLKGDDLRLQKTRREMASRNTKEGQAYDWAAYKTRHQAYRIQEQLGNKRPLTRWQDNGSCKMPDFAWRDWGKSQPERVWDTLDMNFLRTIYRGYDLSYKL
jgi:site-specific DNA-cytosine methylase